MRIRPWNLHRSAIQSRRPIRRASLRTRLTVEPLEQRNLLTSFAALDPGGPANLQETLPVNFVFVGYTPEQIDQSGFLASLPSSYDPVIRSRNWYGISEQVGIHYNYNYQITYTNSAFEDAFFGALRGLARKQPDLNAFQQLYNDQAGNVQVVTDNYTIDAPSVEKWLAGHGPAGVDTTRDTVFFINWWGRDDFVFHTYVKTGEVDPDTGMDFGATRDSRALIAWGGTTRDDEESGLGHLGTHRIWFHDLSAGPDSWTGSWNVDDPDLDGDGIADYRLPAVWEYLTPGGYRDDSGLTADLGKVARYVALDLLFTPSPLYPPSLTPNRLPDRINLDLNTYEGIPGVDASQEFQDNDLLVRELSELIRIPFTVDNQDLVYDDEARDSWLGNIYGVVTHSEEGNTSPYANLFYDAALKQDILVDDASRSGRYVYEAVALNYAVPDEEFGSFLGYADDNWWDGTQSFVFTAVTPAVAEVGYGLTTTQIHEYGHHFGMSHPHDGFDPAIGDYGPSGDFYFAWTGDQVNSMMSYIDLNWDFSQFDRDNANRFLAAAYVRAANLIAADVLESPGARTALALLKRADVQISKAQLALGRHDYDATFGYAQAGYRLVLAAASIAGVPVLPSNDGRTLPPGSGGEGTLGNEHRYALSEDLGPLGPGTRWFSDRVLASGQRSFPVGQDRVMTPRQLDAPIPNSRGNAPARWTAFVAGIASSTAAGSTFSLGIVSPAPAVNPPGAPVGRRGLGLVRSGSERASSQTAGGSRMQITESAVNRGWVPTGPAVRSSSTTGDGPSGLGLVSASGRGKESSSPLVALSLRMQESIKGKA